MPVPDGCPESMKCHSDPAVAGEESRSASGLSRGRIRARFLASLGITVNFKPGRSCQNQHEGLSDGKTQMFCYTYLVENKVKINIDNLQLKLYDVHLLKLRNKIQGG